MNTQRFALISTLAVILVVGGLIGYQAIKPDQAMAAANSPVGSWIVTVTVGNEQPFVTISAFSSDNTMTVMENDGRLGLGVWQKLSGRRYAFTFWEHSTTPDGAILTIKLNSTIELSADKEQYTGPFTLQVFTPDGIQVGSGVGNATGVRMHVELMSMESK